MIRIRNRNGSDRMTSTKRISSVVDPAAEVAGDAPRWPCRWMPIRMTAAKPIDERRLGRLDQSHELVLADLVVAQRAPAMRRPVVDERDATRCWYALPVSDRDRDRDHDDDRQHDQRDDRQAVAEEALADELPVGTDRDEIDLVDLGRGCSTRVPVRTSTDCIGRPLVLDAGIDHAVQDVRDQVAEDHEEPRQHAGRIARRGSRSRRWR